MNLQSRILFLFVALLLGIQAISFVLIRQAIEENARATISSQLEVGERVFLRTLRARGARLADATQVLSSDFGFRSALATGDRPTINSALENQRARAKASFALFLSPQFELVGSAGSALPPKALAALRARAAASSNGGLAIISDGEGAHQFAIAPIKAPLTVGWVAIGFPIDQEAVAELKTLSGFDASIVLGFDNGVSKVLHTSFETDRERSDLYSALTLGYGRAAAMTSLNPAAASLGFTFPDSAEIGGASYGARVVPLSRDANVASYALLMQSIDKAREPYAKLTWTLVALGLGGCATFAFGAFLLARSITRPIVALSRAAESLARGDYTATLPQRSPGELGELSDSFERMRMALGERESRIQKLAYWDALTGLPNREQFRERLGLALAQCARAMPPTACSVAFLDIDRIKNVNDTLGQAAGDELLREVARRLGMAPVPADGMAARISGDKFALLLPGVAIEQALEVAAKVHTLLESPAKIGDSRIDISAGIGICAAPEHADTIESAMSRAEVAMYAAKQAKSPTMVYDPKLDSSSEDSLSLLSDLREAILNRDLKLHYQAKVDLATGLIVGAEALARWSHPTRGFMPPAAFIPFAEQTGFIGQISQWAADEACHMIARLQNEGRRLKISANISTRDLIDAHFIESLRDSLGSSGADPELLCLEITESALMDNPERSIDAMAAIRALGVELSIDDFGTGYSSLGYLRKMPVNELKIDRVFILGLTNGSGTDEKIVLSTIELAHGLGLRVVAEGTEEAVVFGMLRTAGCDIAQGYGVSRPIPEADFLALLAAWTPDRMPG